MRVILSYRADGDKWPRFEVATILVHVPRVLKA